ncbi:MAG: mechanosensitive ion channel family protein, partial [Leptolyngbyaceae bacterium]|nr:mechanosensitive ion channel family protein [Leptolyngbyaceae bacterium]
INALLTPSIQTGSLRIRVPNLFFQVLRALVVLLVCYRILGGVWQIDLSGLATAAGVGSIVIAVALQDTLSDLMSGFLVLLSKPFEVGDYISFDGIEGVVIDQNWRSVTLRHRGMDKHITIPNGTLAKANIENFGHADRDGQWMHITCRFSYDDPPFKVLSVLGELGNGLDQELTHPTVYPVIQSYDEIGINYDIWFRMQADSSHFGISSARNVISARLYYLAKREGLTLPYPVALEYGIDTPRGLPEEVPRRAKDYRFAIANMLASLPYLVALSPAELEHLTQTVQLKQYGLGEVIVQEGYPDAGLYLVFSGSVSSSTLDQNGKAYDLGLVLRGGVFGEMSLFPGDVSPVTVVAQEDTQVIVIPVETIRQLIQGDAHIPSNPKFAADILLLIEERKKILQSVKQTHEEGSDSPPSLYANYARNGRAWRQRT